MTNYYLILNLSWPCFYDKQNKPDSNNYCPDIVCCYALLIICTNSKNRRRLCWREE